LDFFSREIDDGLAAYRFSSHIIPVFFGKKSVLWHSARILVNISARNVNQRSGKLVPHERLKHSQFELEVN
jgi:hypothetical protein